MWGFETMILKKEFSWMLQYKWTLQYKLHSKLQDIGGDNLNSEIIYIIIHTRFS